MTRSVITPRIAYSGSGSTGPFSVTFTYLSNDHVLVYLIDSDDVSTLLTEGTNYTLSANVVTTTDTVDTGETLVIYRTTPVEQDGNFPANGSYSSTTTEAAFDKVVDQVSDLKARVDFFGLPLSGKAPTDAVNAGKYLKLNTAGTALETAEGVDVSALTPGVNCLVIATSNITLSGTQTIDGVSVAVGNTVLVQGQTDKSENGVYTVAAGAWTRHADHDDTTGLQANTSFGVTSGTDYSGSIWVQLVLDPTVGTDDIVFGRLGGSIGLSDILVAANGTINFGNSDVIVTHSSNALAVTGGQMTMTYGAAATSEPLRLVNSTDNASVQVLQLEGDRATPAANDEAYVSLLVSDSGGTQTEIGRVTWKGTTVTDASEAGRIQFGVMTAGTLADEMYLTGTALSPAANDGIALGTTALGFSDLHLATGAVINFANGEMLITETANALAVTGGSLSVTDSTAAATAAITAKNTTDNATVKGITIAGDRATMANNDAVYAEFQLSDSAGNQDEFGRVTVTATDVATGSEDAEMKFSLIQGGVLTDELKLTASALAPTTSDSLALGTTALMFSDAFFASGAVINFNNGDVTFTHAANTMTFAGASSGYLFDAIVGPSSNDGAALGTATVSFSDLFLASGGVLNWNNGDVTVTHSANALAFAGATSGYSFDDDILLPSAGVLNWNAGALTVTHSTELLTLAGGALLIDRDISPDNEYAFALSTPDVAHGVTGSLPTAQYMQMKPASNGGGLAITAVCEDTNITAMKFIGVGDASTTHSTVANGVFSFEAFNNNGTSNAANPAADSNLLVVKSGTTTRFILDADGDSHQDVGTAWSNMDFLDDVETLNALAYHVARDDDPIKQKFEEWTLTKRESLEALKLVSFGDDGRPFMNMSKLAMLNTGAIRQLGEQFSAAMSDKDEKIAALERRLMAIELKKADA